jgi:plastocyanin
MLKVRESTAMLVAAVMLGGSACGGGNGGETGAPGDTAAMTTMVADAGTISGNIDFSGTAPANAPIDMSEEPTCAEKHATPPTQETVMASGGKLANVFVYLKEGVSGSAPAPAAAAEVDQNGCVYRPHVLGLQVGQTLTIRNSDGILHNIKAAPSANRPFNISQPRNMTSDRSFNSPEIMIPVQCDVHGWMSMYIGVVAHPYFAVSGADGSFTIANVPPGTYTVEAWHEKYGTQTQQVTVPANGTATVTFQYSASMAGAHVPLGRPIDLHGDHDATRVSALSAAATR